MRVALLFGGTFQENEQTFIVTAALLEEIGAVHGQISLDDLLAGMDRMLTNGDVPDDVLDDLVRIIERMPSCKPRQPQAN
eukprot:COSAG02_NODE_35096_length_474_cov_0.546667_1_plen_79_part_10